ncbi:MAG: hypothetical protein RIM99_10885 [Cyclobacteriaceae bacterium]
MAIAQLKENIKNLLPLRVILGKGGERWRTLRNQYEVSMLDELAHGVQPNESLKGKKHQVIRLSFDAKQVEGEAAINKVLDYIHSNPVSGPITGKAS